MSLSEQERRALREIEQSLMADDPQFGAAVNSVDAPSGGGFTLRGVAVIVVGLLMLVGGAILCQQSLWFVVVSVIGFLVMLAGAIWMLKSDGSSTGAAKEKKAAKVAAGNQDSSGLGQRMEDNFRRRFEN